MTPNESLSALADFLLACITDTIATAREVQALAVTRGLQPDDPRGPELRLARTALAACEAKRDLVEWALGIEDLRAMGDPQAPQRPVGEQVLRIMATGFAEHEDYREDWKP